MPAYAYRCRECDTSFDVQRSMTDAAIAAPPCPAGHRNTSRVWSAVAVSTGRSTATGTAAASAPPGGGCCGGGCCG